jgi:hypothetical protein
MTDAPNSNGRVILSQNETESLGVRAARGAGFSWGMAEEAGFAAGWLAARGIDGAAALHRLLVEPSVTCIRPKPKAGHWLSSDQSPLCPIHLGAALVDHALVPNGPFHQDTRIDPVSEPVLLLPFLMRATAITGRAISVGWDGGHLEFAADGGFDRSLAEALVAAKALAMTIRATSEIPLPSGQTQPCNLPQVHRTIVSGLAALALRTTVPATAASRSGAGSTTTDND